MVANQSLIWEQQEIVRLLKGAPGTQYQEADEAGQAEIRAWVKNLLATSEITVDFIKADGTERIFATTNTKIYELDPTILTWVDVSRTSGGAYTGAGRWTGASCLQGSGLPASSDSKYEPSSLCLLCFPICEP